MSYECMNRGIEESGEYVEDELSEGKIAELGINGTVTLEQNEELTAHATVPNKVRTRANLFAGNRSSENGMVPSYFSPKIVDGNIVVKVDKEEIEEQNKIWECALIVYVIGDLPRYKFMGKYVAQAWSKVNIPDLYLHDEGYYIAKFHTIGDLKDILYGGPYTISGRPIVLKQWTPDFDIKAEFLMEIPLWVTIPNLPMSYWRNKTLSKLASAIGKPLFADECTTKQTRVSYARILVEANVTKQLPTELTLQEPSGKWSRCKWNMSGSHSTV
ncbi:PREDICTED: uncharacterized protein LOC109236048 [Nicotiana attenuata]|uniref:uncharacterized protein LOC109236048 n=1 Tax=Nicotiana attenuata TaxID=49451 RepID=UPI000905723A|nr:PREDICTED: uncharacterized protein LOC109236048 [Nicotiana attenuata]